MTQGAAARDAQARDFGRRQGRACRAASRSRSPARRRASACSRCARKRRHHGRHRHRAGRQSATDLPAAGHVRALAGARRARRASARAAVASVVATVRETPTWVFTLAQGVADRRRNSAAEGLQGVSRRRDATAGSISTRCSRLLAEQGITRLMVEGGPTRGGEFRRRRSGRRGGACCTAAKSIGAGGIDPLEGMPLAALTGRSTSLRQRAARRRYARNFRARLDMFTGIVTDIGEVRSVKPRAKNLHRITIFCRYPRAELIEGASIACSGVCLTVVDAGEEDGRTWFAVDAAAETLARHHGRPLAARHASQSRAAAQARRRTGRPYRRRPCRRHRDA